MLFLTEDDIRARCPQPDCTLTLAEDERLTPSAAEYAAQMRITFSPEGESASPDAPRPIVCAAGTECRVDMTRLDAETLVSKSHPRIVLRGKLDTLLASTVLVETQFDPKNKLSPYLKECLADVARWVMCVLAAEVSGDRCAPSGMGGMDTDALYTISRDPERYLGIAPFVPSAVMGTNAALCNWLRALVREAEVAAVSCGVERADVTASLNRLSSAVYVLVLLTLAAESGADVTKMRRS